MSSKVDIEQGILKIDGKPVFVWSADYPYYRDQQSDWSGQLDNLKKMNVNVVTFYIPWRHHAPKDPLHGGGTYDFTGKLNDRTNVLEFIRLIREKGMYCIAKPGPYIHAETRFGSLPDYVLPDNNPKIPPRVDMQGHPAPACWGFPKPPAPMDPNYLPYVKDWFNAVAREVIAPNQYPRGPILSVQVLNEGIYSDGGYGVDKFGFDASAIALYRKFLAEKYGTIEKYNDVCSTHFGNFSEVQAAKPWVHQPSRAAVRPWIDWSEFGQWFYRYLAGTYIGYLRECGVSLPMVFNINPPGAPRGQGLETVMGRYTVPYLNSVINYGYTNWCGVVSHNEDSWLKYKIVGKMARGINMEENWGFDSYDPPYYWSVQPSFFQPMAYMLWGATGLNIYLGVSCDCWTDELAVDAGGVYMHNHPIAEDGSYRSAFWTCQQMGALMKHIGDDLVAQELHEPVAWALYSPYCHAASWNGSSGEWTNAGFDSYPHAAWFGWDSFMALCDKNKTQNGLSYPHEESVERLLKHPALFIEGHDWMDQGTQTKLVEYVERGGVLVMTSRVPHLDDRFKPCTILRDKLFQCDVKSLAIDESFGYVLAGDKFKGTTRGPVQVFSGFGEGVAPLASATVHGQTVTCAAIKSYSRGKAILLGFSPWQTELGEWGSVGLIEFIAREFAGVSLTAAVVPHPVDPLVEPAEFRCDARDRRYVYVLTRKNKPAPYKISMTDPENKTATFEVQLPAYSGALVGFEHEKIVSALIKGFNDLDKSTAAPRLKFGRKVLGAADPCDLYFCRREDDAYELSVVNVQSDSGTTLVTLPLSVKEISRVTRVMIGGEELPVEVQEIDGRAGFVAADMRDLKNGNGKAGGNWSPCYLIRVS